MNTTFTTTLKEAINPNVLGYSEKHIKMFDGKLYEFFKLESDGYVYVLCLNTNRATRYNGEGQNGKRIGMSEYTEAYENLEREAAIEEAQESADTEAAKEYDQWAAEADAEYQARKDLQEAKDRQDEEEVSKPKKTHKPRRSKDIAYEGNGLTLTAKQVDFMRHLPDTNFWEQGLDSCIWVDCLCDDIQGQFKNKPMTVGAMISTLCEKGLGQRGRDESRKGKPTVFELTELGKAIAAELGVH